MSALIERSVLAGPQLLWALNVAVAVLAAGAMGLAAAWLLRRRPAPLRYGLLLVALLLTVVAPGGVWVAQRVKLGWFQVHTEPPAATTQEAAAPVTLRDSNEPSVADLPSPPLHSDVPAAQTWQWPSVAWWQVLGTALAAVWGAGVAIGLVRIGWGLVWVARLHAAFEPSDDPHVTISLHQAAGLLGIRKIPAVFTSPAMPVPMVVGLLRPVLVLPRGFSGRVSHEQLQAVVLHETAHIAHGDLWVGLVQQLAAVLFWWCLALHALNRRLSDLREDICDNYVLQSQGDGLGFAQVLVELAAVTKRAAQPRLVGAIGMLDSARGGLEGRVARLLQQECNTMTRMNWTALLAAGSLPPEVALCVSARLAKAVPADPKERAEAEARGVDFNKKLEETWEFTARDVHRVVIEWPEKAGDEVVYRRAESLPFDSKNLCQDLLEGKIFLIEAGEGSGEPLHFAGTDYDIGDRTIEVFVNGKSALWVGEGCPTAGYAESDARAFAALYERLAAQARGAFQANATHGGRGR